MTSSLIKSAAATITASLKAASASLKHNSDSPRLDAEVLLAHALGKPRSHLFAWPDKLLDGDQQQRFDTLIEQRMQGHPVAHLTGSREFWSLPLRVTKDTLIPRPETELLVETAIDFIRENNAQCMLDLGTGSGAIALAIASECPHLKLVACDQSAAALSIADENAQALNIGNVQFIESDWFAQIPAQRFDLIVSNPPYIADGDPHLSRGDVAFEPLTALASGADGLDDIRAIIDAAPPFLSDNGWLLFEHGFDQGASARTILSDNGFCCVQSRRDFQNHERISLGCIKSSQ